MVNGAGLLTSLLIGGGIFFLLITALAQLIFQMVLTGAGRGGRGSAGGFGGGGGYSGGGGGFGGGGASGSYLTKSETTEILTQPKIVEMNQPSLKRWLKRPLYLPTTKRFLINKTSRPLHMP